MGVDVLAFPNLSEDGDFTSIWQSLCEYRISVVPAPNSHALTLHPLHDRPTASQAQAPLASSQGTKELHTNSQDKGGQGPWERGGSPSFLLSQKLSCGTDQVLAVQAKEEVFRDLGSVLRLSPSSPSGGSEFHRQCARGLGSRHLLPSSSDATGALRAATLTLGPSGPGQPTGPGMPGTPGGPGLPFKDREQKSGQLGLFPSL